MNDGEPRNRGGGGIVFGGGSRAGAAPGAIASTFRRRWASGVSVVTAVDHEGGYRGVTVTSIMVVSQVPFVIGIALTADASFHHLAMPGDRLGVSVLESMHEFPAERFAGRAPLPDRWFTGIAHRLVEGTPVLDRALAWVAGTVRERLPAGDHVLVLLAIDAGEAGEDTDDPLISYEGRYRRLEAG